MNASQSVKLQVLESQREEEVQLSQNYFPKLEVHQFPLCHILKVIHIFINYKYDMALLSSQYKEKK